MSNLPKISIIIPSFNAAKHIEECVLSAINQSYTNTEIIIVDDASTDNTISILTEIGKSHNINLIIYPLQKNQGPSNARNIGILNSSGEYISFLDSDDIWYSQKLEEQYNRMVQNNSNLSFSDIDIIKQGNIIHTRKHSYRSYNYKSLLKRNFIPLSTLLIKKELLQKVRYRHIVNDNELFNLIAKLFKIKRLIHEDYAFLLELFRTQNITTSYIAKPLIAYRLHNNNYSKNHIKKILSLYTIYRVNEKKSFFISLFYVIRISFLATLKNTL